jgi:DNA-binding ferritin-like protein (Dps family)
MAGPLIPLLGVVAEFIMANGTRAAAMRYGPKAVEKGLKEIKKRQSAINKRVSEKRAKGEIPPRTQTDAQIEARLANERARRMRGEAPRSRFDEEGFPIDEVPLQFAEGDEVNAGLGSLMSESGRTMSDMDRMMADQAARQGMSPAEQRMMMIQKTAADMGRTISDRDAQLFGMGEISFEEAMDRARPSMDRVSGERNLMQQEQMFFPQGDSFDPRQIGIMGAKIRKNIDEVVQQATETANMLGQEIRPFVDAVIQGYKEEMQSDKYSSSFYDLEKKFAQSLAEGGPVESEIDKALEDIQSVQPDAMVIQQVMTMVMEMIQSGASEEQIVAALKEMGLDDEDIQQVMMMIAEQMQGQDPIQSELSQMM